ncbi:putative CASP-like protein [Hibiscus syriacus]|uniref:CASP-like protein n=1 Tax=Hibiscus syriacus TaxID=106335 RepID=A0A6A2WLT4_HIBSY|nr:putative CASP-like protein [Hibiscus syriacus]
MTIFLEPTHKTDASLPTAAAEVETPTPGVGSGVSSISRRWKRDELLKKVSLIARGFAFFLSLLSFIITASNKHGDWQNFDNYEEYRYLLAIAILSTLYTGVQALRHVNALWNAMQILDQRISAMVDFVGDQPKLICDVPKEHGIPIAAAFHCNIDGSFDDRGGGILVDIIGICGDSDDKQDETGGRQHFYRFLSFGDQCIFLCLPIAGNISPDFGL